MWVDMLPQIKKHNLLPNVNWDVVIDSTEINLQKPDLEIFENVTKKAQVNKNKILFIDNSRANIEAANKFGWTSYFYDSSNYEISSKDLLSYYLSLDEN